MQGHGQPLLGQRWEPNVHCAMQVHGRLAPARHCPPNVSHVMQVHGPLHLEQLFLHNVARATQDFTLLLVHHCAPIAMQVHGQLQLELH